MYKNDRVAYNLSAKLYVYFIRQNLFIDLWKLEGRCGKNLMCQNSFLKSDAYNIFLFSEMIRWKIAQWFELKWWENYFHSKDKAQYYEWKKNYWQNLLDKIANAVSVEPSDTIADLGCGPAGIFILFPKNKVVAIDPLLDKYESNLSFFSKSDYPNVHFQNVALEDFKSTEKMDVVFCMNAINHVSDLQKSFQILSGVAKEKGKIVVTIDAHNHTFFKQLFRLIPGDILHPHQYDLKEYENFLEQNGCKVLETMLLKHEFFFDHYMIVAEKK